MPPTCPASFFDLGAWGWPTIAALGLSTVMSFFHEQVSYTAAIAAKDARTRRTGTIYAAVLVLIIAGASTFLGMAGKLILPDLASSNNVIAALVVELFPHGLKGLVLIGVLSAIMSTADISVLTGSASLTKDIYQRYFHPEASEKTLMRVGLAASLFVGVLGAVFGWFTQDIMNILLITFTINSAGLFLPTIGAFFWKKSCSAGAFAFHALGDDHRHRLVHRRQGQRAAAVLDRCALAELRRFGRAVCRHLSDAPPDPGGAGAGRAILRRALSSITPIPR